MATLEAILIAVKAALTTAASPYVPHFMNIPETATAPYVRWELLHSAEDEDLRVYRDPNHGEETWITISVWAATMTQATQISDAIAISLYSAVLAPSGWKQMRRARRESTTPLPDVESGLFRVMSRWSLRFGKP